MNLKAILDDMKIHAEYRGNQTFDILGRIETECKGKVCAFISSRKYIADMSSSICLVITTPDMDKEISGVNVCIVENPKAVFFLVHNYLGGNKKYERPKTINHIGHNCHISPHAYIAEKNIVIGDNSVIEEFVSIKENVTIGNNVIIRAGSIIGGEGFAQIRNGNNPISVNHLGGVVIHDDVELQQCTCVDSAVYPWDDTVIGRCCRTDNFVHIAHAVKMGEGVFIAAHAMIAGAVTIGDNVWIGPGTSLSNAIKIGSNANITIGAVVTKDVEDGQRVSGNFAIDHSKFIEHIKSIR